MFRIRRRKQEEPAAPERREVPVRVLTPSGWLTGNLHPPGLIRVVDYLNKEECLRMTDVRFEGDEQVLEFFALRRESIIVLAVDSNENLETVESVGYQDEHRITCWVACGALQGVMLIRLGGRLSDYLARHEGLFVVRECRYRVRNPLTMQVEEGKVWALLVNPMAVVGITEEPLTKQD